MEVPHNAELVGFIEKPGVGSAKSQVKVLKSIEMYSKSIKSVWNSIESIKSRFLGLCLTLCLSV